MRRPITSFLMCVLMAMAPVPASMAQSFTHPGCLSTQADLDRMKTKVAASAQPWKASWDILVANSHAQLSYRPNPQAVICRGGACSSMGYSENYMIMANDAHAAYQCALRYHISGDTNYANKAVQIMDAWPAVLTEITGDSNALLAGGIQGYQWACAAELMRNYSGWNTSNFTNFQTMLLTKFYPMCSGFLQNHNGTCNTHYWANWDLCAMTTILSIGVVCDRRDLYNEAINYYKTGIGNGAADKIVFHTHPGYMGQWQEAGRDQGHCTLGPALMGPFCEIAWNQGDDLYGYAANLFLAGAEYVAKFNAQPLEDEVPYVTYATCEGEVQPWISYYSRGIVRPGWDLVYNHYVNRVGLAAIFTERIAAQVRPEGGGGNYGSNSGGYDQLGFTTLTHTRDPVATNAVAVPHSLLADVRNNSVTLSWWGTAYASGYNVKRATAVGGPFTLVASGIRTNLYYVDVGLTQGTTYYYVVAAVVGGVERTNSVPLAVTPNWRLGGTVIGSGGSYNNLGATKETLFDGALGNYYDAANVSGDWAGLDLGRSNVITQVAYAPRIGFEGRMVGGVFQGANVADFSSGVVTLFTLSNTPVPRVLTVQAVSTNMAFRYVRYLGPASGSCNAAEIQFFGAPPVPVPPPAPADVQAVAGDGQVWLGWSVPDAAMSFTVKRATMMAGPYYTLTSGVTATTYCDFSVSNLRPYYYVVSAVNGAGESVNSKPVGAMPSDMVTYLKCDETNGATAADSSGKGNSGTLMSGATWVPGVMGNAVRLDGTTNGYVSFPAGLVGTLEDFSVCAWVKVYTNATWGRVFDFGSGTSSYMFLTPANNSNTVRYAITTGGGEQQINSRSGLSIGAWHHLAVTLSGNTGVLYIDGSAVGTNSAMTLTPSRLGSTSQNTIGKSQWADPTLNGCVDDFRVYVRALNPLEIRTLVLSSPVPTGLVAAGGDTRVDLVWAPSAGATGYTVKRSTVSGGPYTPLTGLLGPTGLTYTDTAVTNGFAYYYVVSAVNASGESPDSVEVSALPALTPAPPDGLVAAAGNRAVTLAWTPSWLASGYVVRRSLVHGGPYVNLSSRSGTTCLDDTVTNGTTYFYTVAASNAAGLSANSEEVSATPAAEVLPIPWQQADIGSVGVSGRASYDKAVFGVSGAGADIWNSADAFHFVYQPLSSNGTITARVMSLDNVNSWAKVGVMFRETLDADSKQVLVAVTPTTVNGMVMQYRLAMGGGSATAAQTTGNSSSLPRWVRLVRTNNIFMGYRSTGGTTWTLMGRVTNAMASTVYVGLAVTSHTNEMLAGAVVSNVTVVAYTPAVPTGLVARADNGQVVLGWGGAGGAMGYTVRRATVSGGPYSYQSFQSSLSCTDTAVNAGTPYYYVVASSNAFGESPNSAEVRATPLGVLYNRATNGTPTASSQTPAPEDAAQAFDGTTATKWYNSGTPPPGWLAYLFGGVAWPVVQYRVSSANDVSQRDPMDWRFEASHDGIDWITLDRRAGEVFGTRFLTKRYNIANTLPYEFYRLNVLANSGGGGYGIQVSELALMTCDVVPSSACVQDGVAVSWRQGYFGVAQTTNAMSCAWCDADGDEAPNWAEYQAGTNPTNGASVLKITEAGMRNGGSAFQFIGVTGHSYRVERCVNLLSGSWTGVMDNTAGTGGVITASDPGGLGLTNRFFRVRVLP